MRTIYLSAVEKQVPFKQYLKGVRLAKANLDVEFKHGLTAWWPATGREIMKQFMQGVHDRINQATPYSKRGLEV